jgi:hypothetical protein
MRVPDRRHLDDLALDQLHAVFPRQDADLDHAVVFVDGETAAGTLDVDRHR